MTDSIILSMEVDKERVYSILNVRPERSSYNLIQKKYDYVMNMLPGLIKFSARYVLKENINPNVSEQVKNVSHIVYCIVSLGREISSMSANCFKSSRYLEGLLVDTIGDQVLFNASSRMYAVIKDDVNKRGYKLTRRIVPGSSMLNTETQLDILTELNAEEQLGIRITSGYMYDPIKTLGYIYGADRDIKGEEVDHNCSICEIKDCKYRKNARG